MAETLTLPQVTTFSNAYNSRAALYLDDKPNMNFWLKEFMIPGFSVSDIPVGYRDHGIKLEGTTKDFNSLGLVLYIDENFQVWYEMYNWLQGMMAGPDNVPGKKNAQLLLFDNSLRKIVFSFSFSGAILTGIGDVAYDNYGSTIVTMPITLDYDVFIPKPHYVVPT